MTTPASVVRRPRLGLGVGILALAGLAVHAAYAIGGWDAMDDVVGDGLYNALILLGAIACVVRGVAVSRERWAWLTMGVGLLSWSAADVYASVAFDGAPPALSAADPLYLAFYPAAYAALILLVRERMTRFPSGVWLDGIIAALATAALAATVLQRVLADAADADGLAIAVNLAYPLGDIVLLGAVVGVIALTGWRPERAWILLAASLAIGAVADAIYLERIARDTYEQGTLLDTLWPLSVLLIALAAWAPARAHAPLRLEGWRLVVAPSVFSLLALGIAAESLGGSPSRPALGLAVACLVATIGRMALAHLDTLKAVGGLRTASRTDPLTGLLNRRALMQRLEEPRGEPLLLAILDLDGFKVFNDRFGHVRGDALLTTLAKRLVDVVGEECAYRLGGDEFCVLAPVPGDRVDPLLAAAAAALTIEIDDVRISASFGAAMAHPGDGDVGRVLHLADQKMYAQKQSKRMTTAFAGLLEALYARMPHLRHRTADVARVARATGTVLNMDEAALQDLDRAIELRDLGLVAVPDDILTSGATLTAEQERILSEHPETAGRMIAGAIPELAGVAHLVRASAERYDGSGRPDALAGAAIPLAARIIAAAHALVAAKRQNGATEAEALGAVRAMSGAALDPTVVRAMETALETAAGSAG